MTDGQVLGIGLLGLGVVGAGVYRALEDRAALYAQRSGCCLAVERVAVRDLARPRPVSVPAERLTTDPMAVIQDPAVQLVVELMGGTDPAGACIRAALRAGKHVVTANKELMATEGPELLQLAQANRVELLFEASVGGGIPIIAPLKRDLQANDIHRIQAIINGTTNFILTAMARDGMAYQTALEEAQRRGYAEADPSADVSGRDAAYKIAILASLAFHTTIPPEAVYCEGIEALTPRDFRYAEQLGYVIRLLATAARHEGGVEVRVHPALVPKGEPLAGVNGVLNAVAVVGDLLGLAIFEGAGAGSNPTTSAVIADVLDVAYGVAAGQQPRPLRPIDETRIVPMSALRMRYYLRILVQDRPGALAELGALFAKNEISIASLLQVEADAARGTAELVITTHEATEADLDRALAATRDLPSVEEIGVRIRMESPLT